MVLAVGGPSTSSGGKGATLVFQHVVQNLVALLEHLGQFDVVKQVVLVCLGSLLPVLPQVPLAPDRRPWLLGSPRIPTQNKSLWFLGTMHWFSPSFSLDFSRSCVQVDGGVLHRGAEFGNHGAQPEPWRPEHADVWRFGLEQQPSPT